MAQLHRSYEKLDEMNSKLDEINRKLDGPSAWDELSDKALKKSVNAIDRGTNVVFNEVRDIGQPFRKNLPEWANLVLDIIAFIIVLVGIISIFVIGNWGMAIAFVGFLLRLTSPRRNTLI